MNNHNYVSVSTDKLKNTKIWRENVEIMMELLVDTFTRSRKRPARLFFIGNSGSLDIYSEV